MTIINIVALIILISAVVATTVIILKGEFKHKRRQKIDREVAKILTEMFDGKLVIVLDKKPVKRKDNVVNINDYRK